MKSVGLQSVNPVKIASVNPHANEPSTWQHHWKGPANALQAHQGGLGTGSRV